MVVRHQREKMGKMDKMDKIDQIDKIAQSVGSNRAYPQDQTPMRKEGLHRSAALVLASLMIRDFE